MAPQNRPDAYDTFSGNRSSNNEKEDEEEKFARRTKVTLSLALFLFAGSAVLSGWAGANEASSATLWNSTPSEVHVAEVRLEAPRPLALYEFDRDLRDSSGNGLDLFVKEGPKPSFQNGAIRLTGGTILHSQPSGTYRRMTDENCARGYLPIASAVECEMAASELGLEYGLTVSFNGNLGEACVYVQDPDDPAPVAVCRAVKSFPPVGLFEKTLECWVQLERLNTVSPNWPTGVSAIEAEVNASPLGLDTKGLGVYNSITLNTSSPNTWMAGSGNDYAEADAGMAAGASSGATETAVDQLVHVVVVYSADGRVRLFRNGILVSSSLELGIEALDRSSEWGIVVGPAYYYTADRTRTTTCASEGCFRGLIYRAAVYAQALTQHHVAQLYASGVGHAAIGAARGDSAWTSGVARLIHPSKGCDDLGRMVSLSLEECKQFASAKLLQFATITSEATPKGCFEDTANSNVRFNLLEGFNQGAACESPLVCLCARSSSGNVLGGTLSSTAKFPETIPKAGVLVIPEFIHGTALSAVRSPNTGCLAAGYQRLCSVAEVTQYMNGPLGAKVVAKWPANEGTENDPWLAATVTGVNSDGSFEVDYENGSSCNSNGSGEDRCKVLPASLINCPTRPNDFEGASLPEGCDALLDANIENFSSCSSGWLADRTIRADRVDEYARPSFHL